jgi:23S rRNA (adenine2030-N6)-methyltransferase
MNYRHAYHAGNFADVVKHVVLFLLIERLKHKETPFFVLDTHAGKGRYDLWSEESFKTGEHKLGIEKLLNKPINEIAPYVRAIWGLNNEVLRWYPGSPRLARSFIRPQDRLATVELHPQDVEALRQEFADDPQVGVHCRDGYEALKGLLPPKEKRGLVLLDPPFEARDEFVRLAQGIALSKERWPNGIIMAWYPVKERPVVEAFKGEISTLPEVLNIEMLIKQENASDELIGCGLAIIGPPWQFDEMIRPILEALLIRLDQGGGRVEVSWISPPA